MAARQLVPCHWQSCAVPRPEDTKNLMQLTGSCATWEHVYGEANVMADAPSRGEFEAMHLLAGHLGISLRRVELPAAFFELLDRVHEFFDTLPASEENSNPSGTTGE